MKLINNADEFVHSSEVSDLTKTRPGKSSINRTQDIDIASAPIGRPTDIGHALDDSITKKKQKPKAVKRLQPVRFAKRK